ncbi:MAG: 3-deoxy-8-phosphooctulonate synthase [Candidatus Neomarinimicrobiota bacterium]|nr:3-deoxy-8-phosphooctulonate synthase [Candidatus Neomarinimicrobiota bacterium]MED5434028.1 3-deoxy-8-phosphooctulonate synthase [Candidatus Neomarinimicrobiota bacterium]
MNTVTIGNVKYENGSFPLIAGPCVIESRDHSLKMAEQIYKITSSLSIPLIFKSSFDKANRSAIDSFRGPDNLEVGLSILNEVKKEIGIPVLTDVHLPDQCEVVAEVSDVLQIPAFLCRQTDLLIAAGKTGKAINIKKGQFLAPGKMKHAAKKIESTGNKNILLTERGTSFGYSLVSDMTSIPIMQNVGYPVIFDATHSAQLPGDKQVTGGQRDMIPTLAKAAVAAGCNGVFMEVHDDPSNAKSDASTQWPLDKLEEILQALLKIYEAVH